MENNSNNSSNISRSPLRTIGNVTPSPITIARRLEGLNRLDEGYNERNQEMFEHQFYRLERIAIAQVQMMREQNRLAMAAIRGEIGPNPIAREVLERAERGNNGQQREINEQQTMQAAQEINVEATIEEGENSQHMVQQTPLENEMLFEESKVKSPFSSIEETSETLDELIEKKEKLEKKEKKLRVATKQFKKTRSKSSKKSSKENGVHKKKAKKQENIFSSPKKHKHGHKHKIDILKHKNKREPKEENSSPSLF